MKVHFCTFRVSQENGVQQKEKYPQGPLKKPRMLW